MLPIALMLAVAPPAAEKDRAAVTADLLASLEAADKRPSHRSVAKRAAALRTLDRLGARPLDKADTLAAADDKPFRGRVLGPAWQRGWLDGGAEMKIEQQFLAGQAASIAVAGAPAAPLTLTVAEPGERPVCRDAARACRWMPLYTQRYAITLRNAGAARVRYYLVLD